MVLLGPDRPGPAGRVSRRRSGKGIMPRGGLTGVTRSFRCRYAFRVPDAAPTGALAPGPPPAVARGLVMCILRPHQETRAGRERQPWRSSPSRASIARIPADSSRQQPCAGRTAVDSRPVASLTSPLVGRPCPPPGLREATAGDARPPSGVRRTEQDAMRVRSPPVDAVPRASRRAATPATGRGRSRSRTWSQVARGAQPRASRSIIRAAAADGLFATGMPKPARIACFSAADSPPGPSSFTIAPA